MGWLSGWKKRKSHIINAATGAGTNYQVGIKVYKTDGDDGTEVINGTTMGKVYVGSNCRDDFGDIRFTDDDGVLLDCWMETYTSGTSAIFWVEVSDSLETNPVTIYVYYKKDDATYPYLEDDTAQGEATFLLFDHFVGDALNTDKWSVITEGNGRTVGSSILKLLSNANQLIVAASFTQTYGRMKTRWHCDVVSSGGDPADFNEIGWGNKNVAADTKYVEFYPYIGYGVRTTTLSSRNTSTQVKTIASGDMTSFRVTEITWSSTVITVVNPDGTVTQTSSTFIPTVAITPKLAIFDLNINNASYLDWIFFSKFVATEPAHSTWGVEENPLLGGGKSIVFMEEMIFG